nr:hypothetical protein CFP56_38184 [Quercus suber]
MATRYSTNKYARVKGLKNDPLSQLTPGSKKRKLGEGKDETPAPLSLFGTPSSPTPSLEMITFTPLTTRSKGKSKAADFSNLDFKAIDTEILADKTKEEEGEVVATAVVEGDGATGGVLVDEGHVKEVVAAP